MAKEEEQISAGAAPIQDSPGPESGGLEPLSDEIDNLAEGTESAVRFLIACVTVRPTNIDYELPN
jgi:hypothetical protein